MFYNLQNFKNTYLKELFITGFSWLAGFSNKINAIQYSIVEIYSTVNQNIVKKTVYASMNHYTYAKLQQITAITFRNISNFDKLF